MRCGTNRKNDLDETAERLSVFGKSADIDDSYSVHAVDQTGHYAERSSTFTQVTVKRMIRSAT